MQVTYYGHSCFSVEFGGKHLLFDPFITPNPLAADIDSTTIRADMILVSHGHEDHVADLVSLAKQTGATVISSFEIHTWLHETFELSRFARSSSCLCSFFTYTRL